MSKCKYLQLPAPTLRIHCAIPQSPIGRLWPDVSINRFSSLRDTRILVCFLFFVFLKCLKSKSYMTRSLSPFFEEVDEKKKTIADSSIIRFVGAAGICQLGVKSGLCDKSIELVMPNLKSHFPLVFITLSLRFVFLI